MLRKHKLKGPYQRFCTNSPVNPLCLQLTLLTTIPQLMQVALAFLNASFLPSGGPLVLFTCAIKINSRDLKLVQHG